MKKGRELEFFYQCQQGLSFEGQRWAGLRIEGLEINESNARHLDGGYFEDCEFLNCKLKGWDFSLADFSGTTFNRCDLSKVCFDNIGADVLHFIECTFHKTEFNGADVSSLQIYGCIGTVDFTNALLENAFITVSHLSGSNFGNANLSNALIEGTLLENVIVNHGTKFYGAKLKGCDVTGIRFSAARGIEKDTMHDCLAYPFASAGMQTICDMHEVPNDWDNWEEDTKPGAVNVSLYKGTDRSAHLYCSNAEEYRSYL